MCRCQVCALQVDSPRRTPLWWANAHLGEWDVPRDLFVQLAALLSFVHANGAVVVRKALVLHAGTGQWQQRLLGFSTITNCGALLLILPAVRLLRMQKER